MIATGSVALFLSVASALKIVKASMLAGVRARTPAAEVVAEAGAALIAAIRTASAFS